MRQQVAEYIERYELIRPGQLVLAAVSGGRDSLVMLHLLASLRYELKVSLAVATFDHGLREEAAAEVRFTVAKDDTHEHSFGDWTVTTAPT